MGIQQSTGWGIPAWLGAIAPNLPETDSASAGSCFAHPHGTPLSSIHDHQLEAILHRGTSSEIWRATRLGPNGFAVPVALKTLNETCAAVPELVRSFLKEARAASAVQHHNVAQIRELILDSNRYWLSMDLVVGWPMRMLLAELDDAGQQIPIPVALSLARDATRGVMAIHEMGLVHRNVSPDNLMVASAGHA